MVNMNKRGMIGLFTFFVLILVVVILALAQNKVDTSTINNAIDTLNWTTIGGNITISMQTAADGSSNEIVKVIINICNKAVDFFGYALFAIARLAMQLARDNPDIINYKVLLWLIILSVIAPLIYPVFIIIVSLILIIKEWIVSRRERKEMMK